MSEACRYTNCPQGTAHHPHDWMREVDDEDPDWTSYMLDYSARERGSLVCGVCNESWPCTTKQEHIQARREKD